MSPVTGPSTRARIAEARPPIKKEPHSNLPRKGPFSVSTSTGSISTLRWNTIG